MFWKSVVDGIYIYKESRKYISIFHCINLPPPPPQRRAELHCQIKSNLIILLHFEEEEEWQRSREIINYLKRTKWGQKSIAKHVCVFIGAFVKEKNKVRWNTYIFCNLSGTPINSPAFPFPPPVLWQQKHFNNVCCLPWRGHDFFYLKFLFEEKLSSLFLLFKVGQEAHFKLS
jgi:hypothetical protein